MHEVEFAGQTVDRCDACAGLWFDRGEREALLKVESSAAIDIGGDNVGDVLNMEGQIDCPRCNVPMDRHIDDKVSHVWFELCERCGGSYLDAGELRELTTRASEGVVRGLFRAVRHTP